MASRYEFFKHSNLIENVEDEDAIDANIAAYRFLQTEGELTHRTVKKVHEIIMKQFQETVDKEKKDKIRPGEYKDVENFVLTGRKKKVFCPPQKIEEKMTELLSITPENSLQALKWYINHQNIHPHLDGNGRTGRVCYYYLCKEVVGCEPVVFRVEDRQGMYDLMNSLEELPIDPEVEYREIDW
jgi:Fic family protein